MGKIIGKALYENQLLDAYFTRSFYKHMLGEPLTYFDFENIDRELYEGL